MDPSQGSMFFSLLGPGGFIIISILLFFTGLHFIREKPPPTHPGLRPALENLRKCYSELDELSKEIEYLPPDHVLELLYQYAVMLEEIRLSHKGSIVRVCTLRGEFEKTLEKMQDVLRNTFKWESKTAFEYFDEYALIPLVMDYWIVEMPLHKSFERFYFEILPIYRHLRPTGSKLRYIEHVNSRYQQQIAKKEKRDEMITTVARRLATCCAKPETILELDYVLIALSILPTSKTIYFILKHIVKKEDLPSAVRVKVVPTLIEDYGQELNSETEDERLELKVQINQLVSKELSPRIQHKYLL